MPVFEITKADFSRFLQDIMKNYELIAPVKTDLVRFQPIKDISLIHLAENSFFPVKEFFFRKQETLFTFNGGKIEVKRFFWAEKMRPERHNAPGQGIPVKYP